MAQYTIKVLGYGSEQKSALRHYGSTCMCCGANPATGAVITVYHIKHRRKYQHLALDFNLQVLCLDCLHGKSNDDDLRSTGVQQ